MSASIDTTHVLFLCDRCLERKWRKKPANRPFGHECGGMFRTAKEIADKQRAPSSPEGEKP